MRVSGFCVYLYFFSRLGGKAVLGSRLVVLCVFFFKGRGWVVSRVRGLGCSFR